jgi:predicted dehydrogenase
MDSARIALIGAGTIGEVHLRALRAIARADVRAVVDTDAERLRYIQDRYNVPNGYLDVRSMLEQEQLDGAIIATPDHLHRESVELAATAGLNILLEKPIATNLADAERIIDVSQKHNVRLMLGFILRFVAPYRELHQMIVEDKIGQPTMAYAKRAARSTEARRIAGRCTVNQYLSVHDIDVILWNMGHDVGAVYATCGKFVLKHQGLDTPDYYWTMVHYRNGATAVAHSHWAMPDAFPPRPESELLVTGTKGSAHLHLDGKQLQVTTNDHFEQPDVTYGLRTEDAGAFRAEDEHFVDCILRDSEPVVNGIDGLNALKIILAAEESIRSSRPVRVEMDQSH